MCATVRRGPDASTAGRDSLPVAAAPILGAKGRGAIFTVETQKARRTIVISDAHGYPQLVRNALEHARYEAGVDRLVFAGDFADRGPDGRECLELIETSGAEVLWGNHDVAVLLGQTIAPQDPESPKLRPHFGQRFREGVWKLALCVEGVLITHAGLSRAYRHDWEACDQDPERLAARLNEEFRLVLGPYVRGEADSDWPDDDKPSLLDDMGPLWFRPTPALPEGLLQGAIQVCGHSPFDGREHRALAQQGLHVVDPTLVLGIMHDHGITYRYAVIEGGAVRVEEGVAADGNA
jgi:hypothetical protein